VAKILTIVSWHVFTAHVIFHIPLSSICCGFVVKHSARLQQVVQKSKAYSLTRQVVVQVLVRLVVHPSHNKSQ